MMQMPGAPSIAVGNDSQANLPGMPKCSLGHVVAEGNTQADQETPSPKPTPSKAVLHKSHTARMLAQSSKLGLEGAPTPSILAPPEIDLATPSPPTKAPKEPTKTDASLNLVTPERSRTPTPKPSGKPNKTPKSTTTVASLDLVTPDSSSTLPLPGKKPRTPSPAQPVARQLFAAPRANKSQASQAPKPEGYWKLLV